MAIASEVKKKHRKRFFFLDIPEQKATGRGYVTGLYVRNCRGRRGWSGRPVKLCGMFHGSYRVGREKKNKYRWQFKVRLNNRMSSSWTFWVFFSPFSSTFVPFFSRLEHRRLAAKKKDTILKWVKKSRKKFHALRVLAVLGKEKPPLPLPDVKMSQTWNDSPQTHT